MKKVFLSLVLAIAMITTAVAQPRAIGVRLGGDVDFSYQHSIASRNMIDLTVGATNYFSEYGYADVNCMFDWVFNIAGGWNWYVGPGVGVGYYWNPYYGNNAFRLNVGGQIGVEYQFKIPLNLSLDWRPMANVLGYGSNNGYLFDYYSIALGVRYRFN